MALHTGGGVYAPGARSRPPQGEAGGRLAPSEPALARPNNTYKQPPYLGLVAVLRCGALPAEATKQPTEQPYCAPHDAAG